jgi:hypothetical protein
VKHPLIFILRHGLLPHALALAVLLRAAGATVANQIGVTVVVAVNGNPVPDGNGSFLSFDVPVINDGGQAAFHAHFTGSGGTSGIIRGNGLTLTQIARAGQAAPDGNGHIYDFNSGYVALNNAGQALFDVRLIGTTGGAADNARVFRGDGTALTSIASKGQTAPDGNGTFSQLNISHFNDAGQATFYSLLDGSSNWPDDSVGIFRADGANLVQIAREGQAAPDGNGSFTNFWTNPVLNNAGQAAFRAEFSGTSNGFFDSFAIVRGDGISLTQIVRQGQTAPDGIHTFSQLIDKPSINKAGQVAFNGDLSGIGTGIFLGDGGMLTQIALCNQTAPDGNGRFSVLGPPDLNDAGQAVFLGQFTNTSGGSTDDRGLFRGDGSTLTQIVRRGQASPDGNGLFQFPSSFALNNAGEVAFLSTLSGTTGKAMDDRGIYLFDNVLGLVPVVRAGGSFLGSTITALEFNGSVNGHDRSGLNNLGQVAYHFTLADGRTGVAIWTVPEPNAALLMLMGSWQFFAACIGKRPALIDKNVRTGASKLC